MTDHEKTIAAVLKVLSVRMPRMDSRQESDPAEATKMLRDAFDINRIFSALKRLRMEDGYVLDYVYCSTPGFDGYPVLYAREQESTAPTSFKELALLPEHALQFPFHALVEEAPIGFIELELLRVLGHQFFFFWHSLYMVVRPVCGEATLRAVSDIIPMTEGLPKEVLERMRDIDLAPTVELDEERATVSMVLFSAWSGFVRRETEYQAAPPHVVIAERDLPQVEYHCGVTY